MRFYTSDLHLGHENIIKYCDRPYTGAVAMDDDIMARWNETVAPGDEIWVLGDLALGKLESGLARVARLNGKITLVPGNHDQVWRKHGAKARRVKGLYKEVGIKIADDPQFTELGEHHVEISHFPFRHEREGDKFYDWRPTSQGQWLLCGHVHEKWRQRGRQINVGVDAWGGYPVSADTIAELIAQGPADRDIIVWER
jgi:calcineurin-like phosphoesterase family protein